MDVQQDRDEDFRQYQSGHLERQTKALESIRAAVVTLLIVVCVCAGLALIPVIQAWKQM